VYELKIKIAPHRGSRLEAESKCFLLYSKELDLGILTSGALSLEGENRKQADTSVS
jgi:hypothetical protein